MIYLSCVVRQDQRLNELQKQQLDERRLLSPQKKQQYSLENILVFEQPCFEIKQLEFIINDPVHDENLSKFNAFQKPIVPVFSSRNFLPN